MSNENNLPVVEQGIVPGDLMYFDLLDSVSTPVFIHRVGHVIYTNEALQKLSGFSREKLLSLPFYEMGYGEWRDILKERGERRMRGEMLANVYEFRLATTDGHECWVELTASRISLNNVPSVFCSLYDLTDRKRAEAAQRNLQQVLSQIIDSDPVATFVVNTKHTVTHWNRACATLTGLPSAEVIGTSLQWKPFYPEERDTMADVLLKNPTESEMIAQYPYATVKVSELAPGAYEGEGFVDFPGHRIRWIFFTAALLRDSRGRVIGAIEKIQDVTERRQAEEALRQYQSQLEDLIKQRTADLLELNQQLEQDVGRREAAEVELRKRFNELNELNVKLTETQQQLQQSEKLASIGQLAAGVAHEINNPIGYVHSNIGSLENYINDLFVMLSSYERTELLLADQPLGAELKALRQRIDIDFLKEDIPALMHESKEGISRVKKIVQDLKDFSRVDSTPEFQWANLHQGIDSTLNVVANEIKYKADVVKEYGTLPEIECLPSQLNQVFMNLLVNSTHAIGEKRGCITIRTGVVGENVWLEFADDGSGMNEEVRKKIFDPFFTTKPVGKGTGLGLSLSYGIIQKHQGTIEVESVEGKGTTFHISLPIRQQHQSPGATPQ